MKHSVLALIAMTPLLTTPAHAIDIWHSSTVWTGQGQCSAAFMFDSGREEVTDLKVTVSAINKAGKKVASNVLVIPQFGQSSADRYADAFLEGEEICEDDLTIVINKASAVIDGKRTDLLKEKAISVRDFKPFKIRLVK